MPEHIVPYFDLKIIDQKKIKILDSVIHYYRIRCSIEDWDKIPGDSTAASSILNTFLEGILWKKAEKRVFGEETEPKNSVELK